MQSVYDAEHLIDAHLVRGRLEAEGLVACVQGEWLTGALGELPASGLLRVCVPAEQAERALALIAAWQQEPIEETADDDGGDAPLPLAFGALRA